MPLQPVSAGDGLRAAACSPVKGCRWGFEPGRLDRCAIGTKLSPVMNHAVILPAAIAAVVGLVICFFGYRLIRAVLALTGFAAGALIGAAIVAAFPGSGQVAVLVGAAIGGVLGAILSALLYKVGVFLLGALAGLALAGFVLALLNATLLWPWLLGAAFAGGLLTLLVERPLLALFTAAAGAWMFALALAALLGRQPLALTLARPALPAPAAGPGWVKPVALAVWILLTILGAAAQRGRAKKN